MENQNANQMGVEVFSQESTIKNQLESRESSRSVLERVGKLVGRSTMKPSVTDSFCKPPHEVTQDIGIEATPVTVTTFATGDNALDWLLKFFSRKAGFLCMRRSIQTMPLDDCFCGKISLKRTYCELSHRSRALYT